MGQIENHREVHFGMEFGITALILLLQEAYILLIFLVEFKQKIVGKNQIFGILD